MVTGWPAMISNSSMKSWRCIGKSLASAAAPSLGVVGEDHLAHRHDAALLEEHMFGAAEPDAVGAEGAGLARIGRGIGIGAHPHAAEVSAQPISVTKSEESSARASAPGP